MSSKDSIFVFTGRWTDYSQGHVLGDRLTMTSRDALVLIAFISIFDGLVGSVVWNTLCYYIHQWRATTNEPRDGLYHQHQALLRNNPDALTFARQATRVGWTWRKRAPHATFRSTRLSLLAIVVSTLFSAVALLSSLIASSGEVLLRNHQCGFVSPPANLSSFAGDEIQNAENVQEATMAHQSVSYAQDCYKSTLPSQPSSGNSIFSPLGACGVYTKPSLSWNVTFSNPCPFGDTCSVPDSEVIKLDTGFLDSLADLGINQPQENRVLWRKIETCSPLVTRGFSNNSFYNVSAANHLDTPPEVSLAATYAYGLNLVLPANALAEYEHNYTFVYEYTSYLASDVAYSIQTASTLFNSPGYTLFWPDKQLVQESDSTYYPLSLFLLSNRVIFTNGAVTDPWFNAAEHIYGFALSEQTELYVSTDPGNVLACLEQAQVCNPNTPNGPACTDLDDWVNLNNNYDYGSPQRLVEEFQRIGFNDVQFATALNILNNLQDSSFASMTSLLGENILQAYSVLESGSQLESASLPPNQWQIEMNSWFGTSLAMMQQSQLFQVTGPSSPTLLQYMQPYAANDTAEISLCSSQKVRSSAYQSFSVLGIAINFVVGGLILVGGVFSRECMFRAPTLRRRTWNADGALELQRLAYEELGLGGKWEGDGTVPLTEKGLLFATPLVEEQAKPESPHGGSRADADLELFPSMGGSGAAKNPVSRETSEYSSLMRFGACQLDGRRR